MLTLHKISGEGVSGTYAFTPDEAAREFVRAAFGRFVDVDALSLKMHVSMLSFYESEAHPDEETRRQCKLSFERAAQGVLYGESGAGDEPSRLLGLGVGQGARVEHYAEDLPLDRILNQTSRRRERVHLARFIAAAWEDFTGMSVQAVNWDVFAQANGYPILPERVDEDVPVLIGGVVFKRYASEPEQLYVSNTRMSVRDVLDCLDAGADADELLEDFPFLTLEHIQACESLRDAG